MMYAILLGITCAGAAGAEGVPPEQFPVVKALPDPFLMNDGQRVESTEQWRRRREEIRELLLDIEYGHVPPPPGNVAVAREDEPLVENDGKTELRRVLLKMGPGQQLAMAVRLYLPRAASGPCPAIVHVGIEGEYAAAINERGYILAAYDQHALAPDPGGGQMVAGPAHRAYPDYDWGSIGVWAWGASRALDYLLTIPEVNPDQVIVTGHSRRGKTALLAGALDERFTMAAPNGSGCGGAGCFRILGPNSETLTAITLPERFKTWFQKDFGRFGGKEEHLPFDQHFVKALVAPRLLLSTEAKGDLWANPLGTQATYLAVQPVYDFLGASEKNAIHFREGKHDQNLEDFQALMDFADKHLRGKTVEQKFNVLPYPSFKPGWTWKAPDAVK